MKIPLLYGTVLALIGAVLNFALYFLGFHDTPEKLQVANWIGGGGGLAATAACLAFAMRDRRDSSSPEEPWSYGSAVGVAVLTGLVAALLGTVFTYLYMGIVNPQYSELLQQAQIAKMQAKGMSEAQIDAASAVMRKMMSPPVMTAMAAISSMIWYTVVALVVAIFFRSRPVTVAADNNEPVAPPPTVGT